LASLKKIVLGIIIAVVILFFGGIALLGIGYEGVKQESTPYKEGTEPVTSDKTASPVLEIGETAKSSRLQVTVFSAEKMKKYSYYSDIFESNQEKTASPGNLFVLIDAEIVNIGSDRDFGGYVKFTMTDSQGFKYDPDFYLGTDGLDAFSEIFQNQKIRGKAVFQVPETATGLKLQYDFGDIIVGTKLATWII